MIQNKKDLKEYLAYEKSKYGGSHSVNFLHYLIGSESAIIWHFQKRLRTTEYHLNTHHKLLYYLNLAGLNQLKAKHSLMVGLNTCEKGLKIMHLGPVLINERARLGSDCYLHINTAIVAKGTSDEVPTLGNGIVVGVGAVILGGISIANNVAIGANSVVNKSVMEENIAVAGAPARKISSNGSLEWNKKSKACFSIKKLSL